MTAERWNQVKRVFELAIERDPEERSAFLHDVCKGDEDLRFEVESLLVAHEDAGSFLERAIEGGGLLGPDITTGRRIGAYSIVREIGRGGMGSVYLGARADDQFHKQVAIKLVRGGMDSEFVVQRFRTERQILANLDHPNIGRLLDGGATDDGLPYFVMEYIEGKPIDEFCDDKDLTIAERLALFRVVCSAVLYAHQNLVVHRDIKPSNVLVDSVGAPKLLDFGIAKILDPTQAGPETGTALGLMTPDFASPEQVRGEPITTSSDIYSLGVVLYVLLTGKRPYAIKNLLPEEILRVVCQEEPPKPSTMATAALREKTSDGGADVTARQDGEAGPGPSCGKHTQRSMSAQSDKLRRRLSGDLDNIILMAMRKEPSRRYASVEQFSEDIRRYLDGLPVIARKDTVGYRVGKFVRRHRAGVAGAALVLALLVGSLIAVAREAHIASVQRRNAERRFDDVRQLADSYMFEFNDAIKDLPGATPARELLVKRALEYLDKLAGESGDNQPLSRDLGTAYQKVGDIQGRPGFPNLGDTAGALASYKKALAIREALVARDPSNAGLKSDLEVSYERMGDVLRMTGDTGGSLETYQKGLALIQGAKPEEASTEAAAVASLHDRIGDALALQGKLSEGLENQRASLSLREGLLARDPENAELHRSIMISYIKVGDMELGLGDKAAALQSYRTAEPIGRELADKYQNNSRYRRELTICYDKVGNALSASHDYLPALDYFRTSLVIREQLSSLDPQNAVARRDLSVSYDKIGSTLKELKQKSEALGYFKKALDNDQALWEADKTNSQAHDDLSISILEYADMQLSTGDGAGALENYRKSAAIREQLCKEDPTNAGLRVELAESYRKIGDGLSSLASRKFGAVSDWTEAQGWYRKALSILTALRDAKTLPESSSKDIEEVTGKLAKCNAALRVQGHGG